MTLRPIAPEDFDDIHAYMGRDDVATWLLEDAYSVQKSTEVHPSYCQRVRFDDDGDTILLAIELDHRVVGDLDFTARSMHDGLVEIGWRVHPDHQGRSLATEAATLLLDLAFHEIGAHRAVASLDVRHLASVGVCERLGIRREAHHVQDLWFKGGWADTYVYAALASQSWARPHP